MSQPPSQTRPIAAPASEERPGRVEFVALMAALAASVAFSIDAMLPALPAMAEALTPEAPNRAQLVVTVFVFGLGLGTLFTGPLSDSFGRKSIALAGAVLYIAGALLAVRAHSLEGLLAARLVQGLGAAGPRVVAMAIIRDRFAGRHMAQIMSFVMMVFTLVPALAPTIGAGLVALWDWTAIFWAFVLFALVSSLWLALRLPETLPVAARRPFRLRALHAAIVEMLRLPVVRLSIAAQSLVFGMLFATISSIQPIYETVLGRADSFPLWFGASAILSASGSVVNALLVVRLGMRRLVSVMLAVQVGVSGALLCLDLGGWSGVGFFAAFFAWQVMAFFQAGLTIGNLNALAMEPVGHIAGTAASVISALSTVAAVALAVPVGLMFDGTVRPLALGVMVYAALGLLLMRAMPRAEARP
ncbi:multidrug effflux MFS transporter [Maliponia aquimaris]|uniref:Bicyclomycin resistance protein n=1 Tax=Maliponia aquimaris TaxID=1673631 RepID=A0A238L6Z5_9RHOB|nr:multidrug effflux MFS transporter [Maliponia aquimaris]SMX50601.1 Bicyclomycin resistance protein [Maliponia aquimaris]